MKLDVTFKSLLLPILCALFIISCSTEIGPEVCNPQISKDDKTIYFQYFDGIDIRICRMEMTDSVFEQISPITSKYIFYNPKLTDDGKKIVFVGSQPESKISHIFMANLDGTSVQELFSTEHVYEAFLSKNKNEIIFSKPDTIANYSPLARKSAHGYDIFSFDMESKEIKKLTNLHSYSIDGVSDYKNDSLLYTDEDVSGICAIARNNTSKPRVIIKNKSKDDIEHYFYYPIFVEKPNVIVFQDSYQIYQITDDNEIKLIYQSDKIITSACSYNKSPRILFTLDGECCFYSINLDGTNLEKKEVNFSTLKKQELKPGNP